MRLPGERCERPEYRGGRRCFARGEFVQPASRAGRRHRPPARWTDKGRQRKEYRAAVDRSGSQGDAGRRLGNRNLSPEHRADDRGVALESARHVEQRGQTGGLFHRQRGADQREDPTLLGIPAAASRRHDGRRQRLVAPDRWRPQVVLEEQSLPDQDIHRRRRFAAPAVGHDRPRRESRYQRHPDRLGRSLRQTLLRPVLDGRAGSHSTTASTKAPGRPFLWVPSWTARAARRP